MSADFNLQVMPKASAQVVASVDSVQPKKVPKADGVDQAATGTANQSADKPSGKAASTSDLSAVVSQLNDYVQQHSRSLEFSVDQTSGEAVVRVVDQKTGELIRQIPSQEMLDLSKKLDEAAGILLKVQV